MKLQIVDDTAPKTPPESPQGFTLTARAAGEVLRQLGEAQKLGEAQETQTVSALRIGVKGGGCSGLSYFMEFAGEPEAGDVVFHQHGVTFYIDAKSLKVLGGTELDYQSSIKESGFQYRNPNQKKTCGCGSSFST